MTEAYFFLYTLYVVYSTVWGYMFLETVQATKKHHELSWDHITDDFDEQGNPRCIYKVIAFNHEFSKFISIHFILYVFF